MFPHKKRQLATMSAVVAVSILSLAACSSGGTDTPSSGGAPEGNAGTTDPASFTVLIPNENPVVKDQLGKLAEGQCKAENDALPIEFQSLAQADVVQRITLLASQDALPSHFVAGTAQVRPTGDLGAADLIVNYEDVLGGTEAWKSVLPAASSTINNVYGQMVSLPYQYNIEGIWYNKQIFTDNGIAEPKTWDDLMAASQKLTDAGVTPFAVAGEMGWPMTRFVGMYIQRAVGPDALKAIQDGSAKLTDPEYVKGAEALAQMATSGYMGEGFVSTDADTANNAFLTGKAAMKYDGSWFLGNINDDAQNTIGAENIGFMPFPDVAGGKGSSAQWPANAGTAFAANKGQFGPKTQAWVECIMENYGQQALQDAGVISGFAVNGEVTGLPAATADIQERIAGIDETVLWFEALFDPKTNSLASSNASLLVTGQMTAEQYMTELQESIDANK